MARVIIGGDICPSNGNMAAFMSGDPSEVFHDLLDEFKLSDLVIANLECPLVNGSSPILKHGPVLGADMSCVRTLGRAGFDVLNLANNHIMDHGRAGLESTLKACAEEGINTIGAGKTLGEASAIFINEIDGIRVGVIGMAEREFSVATYSSGGANPLDIMDFVRKTVLSKQGCDYLIVLIHGGNEYYPYPSPRLKDTCRFMVEAGAKAVIVQHTHCPGCFEEYRGGHIVYGQGNLIFDQKGREQSFYQGFLVRIDINSDMISSMDIVPYTQSDDHIGTKKMEGRADKIFRDFISLRGSFINDDEFLMEQWLKFCEKRRDAYMSGLLGHGRLLQRLNRNGRIVRHLYSERSLLRAQNFLACDAHREVLETIFEHFPEK